jgi:hypothetical protein
MSTPNLNLIAGIFSGIVLNIYQYTQPFSIVTVVLWLCYLTSLIVCFLSRLEGKKEKVKHNKLSILDEVGDPATRNYDYAVVGKDKHGEHFVFMTDGKVYKNKHR